MKKINHKTLIFFICVIFNSGLITQAQDQMQNVHQYICREAYNLLKSSNPTMYDNIELKDWIGNGSTMAPWYTGDQERVVAGAWDEDEEDVIWKTTCFGDATQTHFWKAYGPDNPGQFTPYRLDDCGSGCDGVYNACNRLESYRVGGWDFVKHYSGSNVTFQKWDNSGTYTVPFATSIIFQYDYLVEGDRNLYSTGYMRIMAYWNTNGTYVQLNPPVDIRLMYSEQKFYCYEILGRMCHCLQDIGVPAHANLDPHAYIELDPWCHHRDSYERRMNNYYWNYNSSNTDSYINPSLQTIYDPVLYLAFVQLQVSGRFPSNDVDHYTKYWMDPPFQIVGGILRHSSDLSKQIFSTYDAWGVTQENFEKIAEYCMKTSLRTTAGLFYWFAYKTGQVPLDGRNKAPGPVSCLINLPYDQMRGDYILYKGQTGYIFSSSPRSQDFAWQFSFCNDNYFQYFPLNEYGLVIPSDIWANPFSIQNQEYKNDPCPSSLSSPIGFTLQMKFTAYNNFGMSSRQDIVIAPRMEVVPPSGCPWIYVQSDSGLVAENNVFHKSEFSENVGQDIRDRYLLKTVPNFDSGYCVIELNETEHDYTYLDNFKLLAIDHPQGSIGGISENNDIVLYYPSTVLSTDNATKNSYINITNYIQYNSFGDKIIRGIDTDSIFAHFDSTQEMKKLASFHKMKVKSFLDDQDSLALIGEIGRNPGVDGPIGVQKDYAGLVTIHTNIDSYTKWFSRRENNSVVIIPFASTNEIVDNINVDWSNLYELAYFSVVPVSYSGYTLSEIPLIEATHNIVGDVISNITYHDQMYVELDTTALLMLKFQQISPPASGMVRDYMIETNGHYNTPSTNNLFSRFKSDVNKPKIYSYKLYGNYPNPFNPITTINYYIPHDVHVTIKVFNALGQLIQVLVDDINKAGSNSVVFDASRYASGIYFYSIETIDFRETRKMVILK